MIAQRILIAHADGGVFVHVIPSSTEPPPPFIRMPSGPLFDHRGTSCPAGTPVYYERRYRLPVKAEQRA